MKCIWRLSRHLPATFPLRTWQEADSHAGGSVWTYDFAGLDWRGVDAQVWKSVGRLRCCQEHFRADTCSTAHGDPLLILSLPWLYRVCTECPLPRTCMYPLSLNALPVQGNHLVCDTDTRNSLPIL